MSPNRQIASIELREEPGWVTFSIDGSYAYPSTGEVIDVATREIIATLTDEHDVAVHSEKLLEIDFEGKQPVLAGCQFGLGAVSSARGVRRGEFGAGSSARGVRSKVFYNFNLRNRVVYNPIVVEMANEQSHEACRSPVDYNV